MQKQQLVLFCTLFVSLILLFIFVTIYSRPQAVPGSSSFGEKIRVFFSDATESGSALFNRSD